MKSKTTSILLYFLTFFCLLSYGQASLTIPTEFIETGVPKVGTDEWFSLNHSKNEFGVKVINGKLDIKKVKEIDKSELKILGGTLIGVNRGEFGGQLIFKPED